MIHIVMKKTTFLNATMMVVTVVRKTLLMVGIFFVEAFVNARNLN